MRPEKDRSRELNIPESLWAMKDNFCGNAVRKRKKGKTPVPGQKIKPLYQIAEGLWRGSQIVKISFMFSVWGG